LIIGDGDGIYLADLQRDPVELSVPAGELFISGWVRVPVVINDPTIAFEDLEFLIDPPESGAMVSISRDNSFDVAQPTILLTAGWATGEHRLIAVHRPTGDKVGQATFNVLDTWTDSNAGPSIATFGSIVSGPDSGTWGGPDSGDYTVPQNVKVHAALGTHNVAVVLVDTASARYPMGAALNTIITNIRDEMVNGVAIGGQTRSVTDYFDQASNGLFNLHVVDVVGPISLPNNWTSYLYFHTDDTWVANDTLASTIVSEIVTRNTAAAQAGNPLFLDLSQVDSLIYVLRSRVSPPDPDLFVWPRASTTSYPEVIGSQEINVGFGTLSIPLARALTRMWMPEDWATRDGVRAFHETVVHELGHNLGLIDQYAQDDYTDDAKGRITGSNDSGVGSWELMTFEQGLPLPSAAHRLMLGWLKSEHVRLYNFGVAGAVDETIRLHAAGAGAPPAGRFGAAEVRIEDGKNFYFEYRPTVAGRIVDTDPMEINAVLATEALTRLPAPKDRAQILLVSEDADGVVEAGSFLTGQDFRDRDTTTPGFERDFIVEVLSTTADEAKVRFVYDPDIRPDPSIKPWSPSTDWQSPDLEVINGRSQGDAAFHNVPWEGHDNTIQARVSNFGKSDAHGVTVRFFAKDFTFGGGAEVFIGEQTQDVPIGTTVTFVSPVPWRPAQLHFPLFGLQYQQHSCVVARFGPFLDPVTNIWEVTPENNEAQSNYTWMASSTSSPASREVTAIVAENPFDKPAIISFTIRQPNPLFRVYLSHRWVRLQPGEQRQIVLMTESLLGDTRFDEMLRDYRHYERRIETTIRLSAYGDTLEACAPSLIGGATVLAMTGLGTHFEWFENEGGLAYGRVVQTDTGMGVDGKVLVSVMPRDPERDVPERVREADAIGGEFRVEHGQAEDGWRIQAHYLGRFPWMPSDSKLIAT
jgi:M6 family metalloprotease-like protein